MAAAVVIREYDPATDRAGTEAVDRECEVGPAGGMSLHADLLGDPLARVRHSPAYLMLVAEAAGGQIVGLIRGTVKSVATAGATTSSPASASVGYILGLRVSPSHRRMGVALRLVRRLEQWFERTGAAYAYMATDKSNEPSLRLFTGRCGYSKFRTPSLLVHPVHAHRLRGPRRAAVHRLAPRDAERLYRARLARVEFFPADIGAVLGNPLSLGTFVSIVDDYEWRGVEAFLASPPASWAVASLWDCGGAFRLEVRGASRARRAAAAASRALDARAKWMRVPSVPDFFRPFVAWFVYGLGGGGDDGSTRAAEALFVAFVNMARGRAAAVAVEVAACDPLRRRIPHWRSLSCEEDLWCMKRLGSGGDVEGWDWARSAPGQSIFVDPREV
ncbi:hypothetical protein BRADI_1g07737v3 [Brachypodium distachyon]|uniref:N-acetyltransferase domain-containing protein n=2 Tax=Brachypodium distachyon TaxID=15368 RepID=I1GN02_BRADI|nr:hypothetical protein BRADI_1g07737v3 [Brachypodium distachyon]